MVVRWLLCRGVSDPLVKQREHTDQWAPQQLMGGTHSQARTIWLEFPKTCSLASQVMAGPDVPAYQCEGQVLLDTTA